MNLFFGRNTLFGSQRCNEAALPSLTAWRECPDPEPSEEMQ